MTTLFRILAIVAIVPLMLGCLFATGLSTDVPPSGQPTNAPGSVAQNPGTAQAAINTANSFATTSSQENLDKASTLTVEAEFTQQTINTSSVITQNAQIEAIATQESLQAATAQAKGFYDLVQALFEEGLIKETEGQYYLLDDFDEQLDQSGQIKYVETGHSANNFILSADTQMNLYSEKNWPSGGCGIQLGKEADLMEINTDGFVYYVVSYNLGQNAPSFNRFGKRQKIGDDEDFQYYSSSWNKEFSKEHEFNFRLVVFDKQATLFIDGQEILSEPNLLYDTGSIDLFVSSTTPKVTTRCQMTNIDLWIFDQE